MEPLKLNSAIEAIDLVKKLSWASLPLWFSIAIPIFYFFLSAIFPKSDNLSPNTDLNPTAEEPSTNRLFNWIKKRASALRVNGARKMVTISILLFVIGTITILIEKNEIESIRLKGLTLKAYCKSQSFSNLDIDFTSKETGISEQDLFKICEQFPSEFNKTTRSFSNSIITSIAIVDSTTFAQISRLNINILRGYLKNKLRVADTPEKKASDGHFISLNDLYNIHYGFTYKICYELLSEQGSDFALDKIDYQTVIVRVK